MGDIQYIDGNNQQLIKTSWKKKLLLNLLLDNVLTTVFL